MSECHQVLTATAWIRAFVPTKLNISLRDVGDGLYDSAVFLEGKSFRLLSIARRNDFVPSKPHESEQVSTGFVYGGSALESGSASDRRLNSDRSVGRTEQPAALDWATLSAAALAGAGVLLLVEVAGLSLVFLFQDRKHRQICPERQCPGCGSSESIFFRLPGLKLSIWTTGQVQDRLSAAKFVEGGLPARVPTANHTDSPHRTL
jgi:hypothetical protein